DADVEARPGDEGGANGVGGGGEASLLLRRGDAAVEQNPPGGRVEVPDLGSTAGQYAEPLIVRAVDPEGEVAVAVLELRAGDHGDEHALAEQSVDDGPDGRGIGAAVGDGRPVPIEGNQAERPKEGRREAARRLRDAARAGPRGPRFDGPCARSGRRGWFPRSHGVRSTATGVPEGADRARRPRVTRRGLRPRPRDAEGAPAGQNLALREGRGAGGTGRHDAPGRTTNPRARRSPGRRAPAG